MDLKNELVVIERSLWTNDAEVYAANLTEEAVLVFAETGVIRRDVAVEAIKRDNAEGDRIAAVGSRRDVRLPLNANLTDLGRLTLLPGLIDAHGHLTLNGVGEEHDHSGCVAFVQRQIQPQLSCLDTRELCYQDF